MRQKVMYVLHDRATDAGKRLHWSIDAGVLSARPYICKVILEAALSSVRTCGWIYSSSVHGYGGFLRTQRNISHSAPSHHAI